MARTQDFRTFSAHVLPERPHLDHLRAEAKRRHAVLKAVAHSAQLADAQPLVARGYGFSSWMALKVEVDRRRLLCGAADIPVMAVMRPPRERHRSRLDVLGNPALAEQALFALMGMVVAEFSGVLGALLHALLG